MHLVQELFLRNPYLSIYGALCMLGAMMCFALVHMTEVEILGINAFVKPLKFFLSIGTFCLTMNWLTELHECKKEFEWEALEQLLDRILIESKQ